jgi:hypothetical protein
VVGGVDVHLPFQRLNMMPTLVLSCAVFLAFALASRHLNIRSAHVA